MPTTLVEDYHNRYDSDRLATLKAQITAAIARHAQYIIETEAADATDHAARLAWAKGVFASGDALKAEAERFITPIVLNGTVADELGTGDGAVADNDVEYVVNLYVDSKGYCY